MPWRLVFNGTDRFWNRLRKYFVESICLPKKGCLSFRFLPTPHTLVRETLPINRLCCQECRSSSSLCDAQGCLSFRFFSTPHILRRNTAHKQTWEGSPSGLPVFASAGDAAPALRSGVREFHCIGGCLSFGLVSTPHTLEARHCP